MADRKPHAVTLTPKSSAAVLSGLTKTVFQTPRLGYVKEGAMLKAKCTRFANRTMVVGKTAFVFDKDGICSVADVANTRVDYEQLLTMNQVTPVTDDEPLVSDPPEQTVTEPDKPGEVTTTAPDEPEPAPEPTATADAETSESESKDSSKKKKTRRPTKK